MAISPGSNEIQVAINGDASGLQNSVATATSSLSKLKTAVGGASAGLAALGAAGVAKSVTAFADFDQQLTQSEAIMGDVSDAMSEKLAQTAESVAGRLGTSSDKAAKSYYYLASAGFDAKKSMEAMPKVAEFAAAGQMEMSKATDYATDVMKAFQIPADNMTKVTDSMTAAVTRHNQTLEGMGTAMSYVAPVAKGLGMSVEETSAAIGMLGDAGIKGSKAGTTLRQALNKLSNPTKKMQRKLSALGVNVKDSSGEMRDFSAILTDLKEAGADTSDIMQLFGARAGPGMQVLLEEGGKAIDKEAKKIKSMGGVTKDVAKKQLDTLNKKIDILTSKFQNLFIDTGRRIAPFFTRIVAGVTKAVDWFSALNKKTDGLAGVMSLLGVILTGVTGALGVFVGGPITLLPGLIATIGAAFSKNFLGVRDITMEVVSTLREQFLAVWSELEATVLPILSQIANAWQGQGGRIRSVASGLATDLGEYLVGELQTLRAIATGAIAWIASQWSTHGEAIVSTISTISGHLTEGLIQAMAMVRALLDGDMQQVRYFFDETKRHALAVWETLWSAVLSGIKWAVGQLAPIAQGILEAVSGALRSAWDWVRSKGVPLVREGFDALVREASKAFGRLTEELPPILRQAVNAGMAWLRSTGVPLAKQAMRRLGKMAIQGLEYLRTEIYPVIRQAISSAMNWVQNKGVPMALNALRFLGRKAAEGFALFKREILPVIVSGVNALINWVVTKGIPLLVTNLKFLARQAGTAFSILKNQLLPFAIKAIDAVVGWLRSTGVPLAMKGLRFLAEKAGDAFVYLKKHLPPIARQAISALVSWIRTTGVPLARQALSFLADKAAVALGVLRRRLPPLVRQAIQAISTWIRNSGVPLARQALDFLAQQAGNAFAWLQTNLPPIINDAVSAAIDWVRTEGVSMAKRGLSFLAEQAGVAWDAIKDIVSQAIQDAIGAVQSYLRNQATTDIKNAFRALGSGIRTVLTTLFSMGKGLGGVIATFITDTLIPYLKNDAVGDLKSGAEVLFTTAIDVLKAIFKMGAAGTETIGGVIKGLIDAIVTYLKNDAGDDLKTAAEALFEVATSVATGFAEGIIGEEGVIKTLIGDIVSYITGENGAKGDVKEAFKKLGRGIETAFEKAAEWAVDAFNGILPDSLDVPEMKIPRVSITAPDVPGVEELSGQSVGAGPWSFGGQSFDIPQLHTGGLVEETGPALLEEGELVTPAAEVDRSPTATPTGGGSTADPRPIEARLVIDAPEDSRMAEWMRENASLVVEDHDNRRGRAVERGRRS